MCCDNMVTRLLLATIGRYSIGQTFSKYCIPSINVDTADIKNRLWKHFVDSSSNNGKIVFLNVCFLLTCLYVTISVTVNVGCFS